MAFLDNSGDIILDAVLTDTGRFRLAKGDGSFKISKFALGDDEINYESYNRTHSSGSAYFDLDILQTPVLEAFTNNTSTMNSKLITIPRTNLLFLPVLEINTIADNTSNAFALNTESFFVAVDTATETEFASNQGTLKGATPGENTSRIRIDQGLDTIEIPPSFTIDPDLKETNYIIQMDDRLGKLTDPNNGGQTKNPRFIDDDNIAFYYLSAGTDSGLITDNNITEAAGPNTTQVIDGPRGTKLEFAIASSIELQTSTFLFNELGGTFTLAGASGAVADVKFIDTIIKVTGATTGYSIDVKVRYIKKP